MTMLALHLYQLQQTITKIPELPSMEQIKAYIILAFTALVAIAFLVSLIAMIFHKNTSLWLNIFLTCLGYIVGILTGLLGVPLPPHG